MQLSTGTGPVNDLTVVISQPMYFPWVGFLEMMKLADVFIWLDDVQFSKGSFTNRVQVKTPSGRRWMTIPLAGKGTFRTIRDLEAADQSWRRSHRTLLQSSLAGAAHDTQALALFDAALAHSSLCDVLVASAEGLARAVAALPPRLLFSTDLDVPGQSWRRVIALVKAVGGTRYVSAAGGTRYLDHEAFERAGIIVDYMKYDPRPWPQTHGPFTPYVTGLDLIAACGPQAGSNLAPAVTPWRHCLAKLEQSDEHGTPD